MNAIPWLTMNENPNPAGIRFTNSFFNLDQIVAVVEAPGDLADPKLRLAEIYLKTGAKILAVFDADRFDQLLDALLMYWSKR